MKLLRRLQHEQAAIDTVRERLGQAHRCVDVAVVRVMTRSFAGLMPLEVAGDDTGDATGRKGDVEQRVDRLEQQDIDVDEDDALGRSVKHNARAHLELGQRPGVQLVIVYER